MSFVANRLKRDLHVCSCISWKACPRRNCPVECRISSVGRSRMEFACAAVPGSILVPSRTTSPRSIDPSTPDERQPSILRTAPPEKSNTNGHDDEEPSCELTVEHLMIVSFMPSIDGIISRMAYFFADMFTSGRISQPFNEIFSIGVPLCCDSLM